MNKIARLTGFGYLSIFITGFFANFYTLESLVVNENAAQTAINIMKNLDLYELGFIAFAIMVIVDILLAFPLYLLLKSVNRRIAWISSGFRLINGCIFAIALISLFRVFGLIGSSELENQVLGLVAQFNKVWNIGLLFFGIHLLLLGRLIFDSIYFPTWIGVLLMVAGVGYLIDSGAQLGYANYAQYQSILEMVVIVPGVLGELSLTLWMLIKGYSILKRKSNEKRYAQAL